MVVSIGEDFAVTKTTMLLKPLKNWGSQLLIFGHPFIRETMSVVATLFVYLRFDKSEQRL